MDNKKIGKLIADLRKKQNLTQQELGDKVGVGFRAVSKWERGLTLPDITIINELSKILGITSDELLAGELNEISKVEGNKKKKEIPAKIKITISVITCIILLLSSIVIYFNNKTYIYGMSSTSKDYYIDGQVIFKGDKLSILVNKLRFKEEKLSSTIIKNYEYQITSGDTFIYGFGYDPISRTIEAETTIKSFCEKFHINFNDEIKLNRKEILKNNITISIIFTDINGNEIKKDVGIFLYQDSQKINK